MTRSPVSEVKFSETFWLISTVICWDCIKIRKPTLGTIIVLAVWICMSFILVTGYIGVYTALISAPQYLRPPIETLSQLEETGMKIVVCNDRMKKDIAYAEEIFPGFKDRYAGCTGPDDQNPYVNGLNTTFNDPENLVMLNFEGSSLVYIREYSLEFGGRKFYFSENALTSDFGNLFFRHNCYFKEAMNQKITLLHDMGFINNNVKQIDMETRVHIKAEMKAALLSTEKTFLKLRHFLCGFALLGIGYLSASVSFLIDLIFHKL